MASKTTKKSEATKKTKAPVKKAADKEPREVSLAALLRVGACSEQVEMFEDIFGESVKITVENIKKAEDEGLDLEWICEASQAIRTEIEKVWFGRELRKDDWIMDTDGNPRQVNSDMFDDSGAVNGYLFTYYEPAIYKLVKE